MNILVLNDQVNGYLCDILADLLLFQHTQVNRLDFNTWKCWQTCHYIELSEYKLYMGHIHTLVLTRGWIAMLIPATEALTSLANVTALHPTNVDVWSFLVLQPASGWY